jgi:flavin-dependent thymidylate synthase
MKINLIDHTAYAVDKLLYTKNTRLTLGEATRDKITQMTDAEKMTQLYYMSTTIPSSWEFVSYTFEILGVTRAFTHQFVRTRTGSFAQQTMRMLNVEKFQYLSGPTIKNDALRKEIYDQTMERINNAYQSLIKLGANIEDARGVLPTNILTNIIAQFNLRTLSELVKSRSGYRTQDEYRKVIEAMIAVVLEVHPWAKWFLTPERSNDISFLETQIKFPTDNEETKTKAMKILVKLRKEQ